MDVKRFLPECDIDTLIVHTILQSKLPPNHKKNINKVVAAMKNDYAGQFCVGIVDIVKDFNNFKKGFYKINNYGDELLLYKHDNHQQYLVYIKDGAERFIWNCCQSANVDLTLYGLPNSYENLVQISKHPLRWTHEQKSNFKRLFKELIKIKNNGFYVLSNWICYLNEKREKSDEQEIIKLN